MKSIAIIAVLLIGLFPQAIYAQSSSAVTNDGAIALNSSEQRIHIYPNPSKSVFFINNTGNGHRLEVYDQMGHRVLDAMISGDKYPVDLTSHGKGIYTYQIMDDGNLLQQGRLVLE